MKADVDAASRMAAIRERMEQTRARTLALIAPISDEALTRQHSPLMSPIVWDLGHIAAFEELWLVRKLGEASAETELKATFDAARTRRSKRGALRLPEGERALARLAAVREATLDRLERLDAGSLEGNDPLLRGAYVYELVRAHEAQHQETILQTILLMRGHLYRPAARHEPPAGTSSGGPDTSARAPAGTFARPPAEAWVRVPAGPFDMGAPEGIFCYDNERPRHRASTVECDIGRFPVSNAGWLEFMAAGGYTRRALWSEEGWAWRTDEALCAPLFWRPADPDAAAALEMTRSGAAEAAGASRGADGAPVPAVPAGDAAETAALLAAAGEPWVRVTSLGEEPVDPDRPVVHVCWHEAEAYARFRAARLPTEAEWEKAAGWDPDTNAARLYPWGEGAGGNVPANLDQLAFGVAPLGAYPAGRSPLGCEHMLGDVWEWTSSPFTGYPGFQAFPYRDYSEVFFGDTHRVLRGGSWATRAFVPRVPFRNWDLPIRRQIFAGLRLARDV